VGALRIPQFEIAKPAAQVDLANMCEHLRADSSPLHSRDKKFPPACTMQRVRDSSLGQANEQWPLPESTFHERMALVLSDRTNYRERTTIGFHNSLNATTGKTRPNDVGWLMVRFHSKVRAMASESIGRPEMMEAYMHEWKDWFAKLPLATNASSRVLDQGFVSCRSWELYPTLQAFLAGVFRSLIFTPLFCMGAVFAIVRDVAICYAALVSVVGMIILTMGLLYVIGTPLGPIESLALAVIIGVSIDYLIHLAFAYKNSLMQHRYYKSRAAMLARTNSIVSAALTTLCSVVPLLGAKILPFRQFGTIFTIVTLISLLFSLAFFNAFLMAAGPLQTRPDQRGSRPPRSTASRDDADIQAAQLEVADEVADEVAAMAGWETMEREMPAELFA